MTMNFKSVDFKSNQGFTLLCTLLLCVLLITLVASTALGAVSLDQNLFLEYWSVKPQELNIQTKLGQKLWKISYGT